MQITKIIVVCLAGLHFFLAAGMFFPLSPSGFFPEAEARTPEKQKPGGIVAEKDTGKPIVFPAEPATEAVEPAEAKEARSLMVLDLTSNDLDGKMLKNINALVCNVLRRDVGLSLVTQQEIAGMVSLGESARQMACIDSRRCIMEIADAVKNELLFGGKVSKVGELWSISLYLLDAGKAETLARVTRETPDLDKLEAVAEAATMEILKELGGFKKTISIDLVALGENPKVAVMDFIPSGVDEELARTITNVVTVELRQFKQLKVISRQDIAAMLSFEGYKQQMGCEDDSCFVEIGAALGVGFLVIGNVGLVQDTYILSIKVMNNREARVIGRDQESFVGPADGLLPAARFVLRRVFGAPYEGEGMLKISISEEKAAVSLDGKGIGLTPEIKLPDSLAAGKYRIEVTRDKFFPLARDIYVEPARQTQVQLVLEKQPPEWWETWWFWTSVGVVVAGGVTAGVVLGTMDRGSAPAASGNVGIKGTGN